MLDAPTLENLSRKLYIYDVVQAGWEQEPQGPEINAGHVLKHLVKDLAYKDFADAKIVQDALAPDALQYALRLGRWASQPPESLRPGSYEADVTRASASRLGSTATHRLPYTAQGEAAGTVAQNLHDLEHARTRDQALQNYPEAMKTAARFLIHAAELHSHQRSFDLVVAFDVRLEHLRERFGIPQP